MPETTENFQEIQEHQVVSIFIRIQGNKIGRSKLAKSVISNESALMLSSGYLCSYLDESDIAILLSPSK